MFYSHLLWRLFWGALVRRSGGAHYISSAANVVVEGCAVNCAFSVVFAAGALAEWIFSPKGGLSIMGARVQTMGAIFPPCGSMRACFAGQTDRREETICGLWLGWTTTTLSQLWWYCGVTVRTPINQMGKMRGTRGHCHQATVRSRYVVS